MTDKILNAFTCTGAYAVLILSGLKRVENRSAMPVPARGRCAMSVSKKFCREEYENLAAWVAAHGGEAALSRLLPWDEVKTWPGCLVATMEYEAVGCRPDASAEAMGRILADPALARECRIWNEGYPNWWILTNIRRLPAPVPCRGNVGMWRLPPGRFDILARVERGDDRR